MVLRGPLECGEQVPARDGRSLSSLAPCELHRRVGRRRRRAQQLPQLDLAVALLAGLVEGAHPDQLLVGSERDPVLVEEIGRIPHQSGLGV